jgi:hypothetical protein
VRRLARDDVCLGSLPRIPVVAVGFDKRLVANPDRPSPGILLPPAAGYGNLDECGGVGCQPLLLEPFVFGVPFIAFEAEVPTLK